jgi:hypothetical protein
MPPGLPTNNADMLTVHVRITDSSTGKPTPVRARFGGPAGETYVPFGRLADFPVGPGEDVGGHLLLGGRRFVYLDGGCEVRLPAGVPVTVEIAKGPEYSPLFREVKLGAGQISLRFTVDRWTDLRRDGWYAGDTRVRALTPRAALLEGAAEGLAVVNLLAGERPARDILSFSGTRPELESPGHLVAVNTLNTHPVLGTVSLLDSHRAVFPLSFGGPEDTDDWSVADWCDQCHRKRGLVVWPDVPRLVPEALQGEALAAALLGKIDAFEISACREEEPAVLSDWYALLGCGLRLPLAGGSGKDSNAVAVGSVRTYGRLPPGEELSYGGWVDAVRAGRSFITNGPLLTLEVDGEGPGHVFDCPADTRPVRVRVDARGSVPFDFVEVLWNGQVIADRSPSGDRQSTVLEAGFTPARPGWIAARCRGRDRLPDGQFVFAHTSPVWFRPGGGQPRPREESATRLLTVLDQTLAWTAQSARCQNPKAREHLLGVLGDARRVLTE